MSENSSAGAKYCQVSLDQCGYGSWACTILGEILIHPLLWVCIAAYTAPKMMLMEADGGQLLPELSMDSLSLPGGLGALCLTFYNAQCYMRYSGQLVQLHRVEGGMRSMVLSMKHGSTDRHQREEFCRYLGLAYFCAVSCLYQGVDDSFDMVAARDAGVMTQEEMGHLHPAEDPDAPPQWFTALSWAFEVVEDSEAEGSLSEGYAAHLQTQVHDVRACIDMLLSLQQMSFHSTYFNVIDALNTLVCAAFAYAAGVHTAPLAVLSALGVLLGFLALRQVACKFAHPFGRAVSGEALRLYADHFLGSLAGCLQEGQRPVRQSWYPLQKQHRVASLLEPGPGAPHEQTAAPGLHSPGLAPRDLLWANESTTLLALSTPGERS